MDFSLADRLDRLAALKPARAPHAATPLPVEAERLGELLGGVAHRNRYGEHLCVRRWYADPEACAPTPDAIRRLAPEAGREAADPAKWLFLDAETTGLAGGTGTYAFLVGVAWWDAGGLQLEQFFMRDHSEEHSLLFALGERLGERRVLVTFNGKSFDWPLLETRYKMTRQIEPRTPRAHLDLLHPARQLWRMRLGSVRLAQLERHVLAAAAPLPWDRRDDLPAQLIPQRYFDFLRGGPAAPLADIFRHNQMDLRGLAALAGRIVALLAQAEDAAGDPLELYGLSRLLRRRGEPDRARQLCERALEGGLDGAVDRAARRELAGLAKRQRDDARATSLWEGLIGDRRPGADPEGVRDTLEALEQLAIYHEHRARPPRPERAAAFTRTALGELRRAFRRGAVDAARYRRLASRFEHRLARLGRKASSAPAD